MSNENNDLENTNLVPRGPGRPKGSEDVKPRLAKVLWEGLIELSRRQQQTLPEIVAGQLEKNFNGTLATFSRFLPKTIQHEGHIDSGLQVVLVQYNDETKSTIQIDATTKLPMVTHQTKPNLKDQIDKYKAKEAVIVERVPAKANKFKDDAREPKIKPIMKQNLRPPRRALAQANKDGAQRVADRLKAIRDAKK